MWISKQISKSADVPAIQMGKSTLNSNGNVEAVATTAQRNLRIYSPYGYCYSLPADSDILLADTCGEQVGIGILQQSEDIATGEIKITASSGAYIYLRADGSVIINGLKITRDGVIE